MDSTQEQTPTSFGWNKEQQQADTMKNENRAGTSAEDLEVSFRNHMIHTVGRPLELSTVLDQYHALAAVVPQGPWLYPEDDLTDLPDRLLAAETVREQIFMRTHEEVPYAATVETESFKERRDGSVRIDVTIYVARPGHKAILIGDKGSKIKAIGARARQDLTGLLDRPVHLFLNVKERKGWDEEGARLRAIGLEDPGRA